MLIYNYDKDTKEYIDSQVADSNPEETKKQGHFVPLIPANATDKEPPTEQTKKARIFNTETEVWSYTDDFRGDYKINADMIFEEITKLNEDLTGYDRKTKAEKEAIELDGIGKYEFVNNHIVKKSDSKLLQEAKDVKYAENNTKADNKRYNQEFTITLQGKSCVFDTTKETQSDLLSAFAVCSTGGTYDGWICNNGVEIDLTSNDLVLIQEKFKELTNVYPHWNYFKKLIDNATTVTEVEAIVIDYDIVIPTESEV